MRQMIACEIVKSPYGYVGLDSMMNELGEFAILAK